MKQGRIPAQCAQVFDRIEAPLSRITNNYGEIIHQTPECQPKTAHNFCDHLRLAPKFFKPPTHHKPRALVIQKIIDRLSLSFNCPRRMLATIQFHYQTGYRVKSQRREAILRLLQVMVYYMDDATGRVGRLLDNGLYEYYTMKKLAKFAGLKFKRAKRAMKAIVRAGYIKVTRQYKMDEETGKYEGRGSRREFLPKFFIDLDISGDLWTKWFSQKNWKREREEKKRTKQDIRRAWSAIGFLKESIGHSIDRAKKPIKRIVGIVKGIPLEDPFPVKEAKIAHEKNLIAKALNLFNLDPSKSVREYLQELKALHPPP